MNEAHPNEKTALNAWPGRRVALLGLLVAWCWFSLLASGHLGLDSRNRYEVTRNLIAGNGPVSPKHGTILIEQDGGEAVRYTRYHLGQSLLLAPFHVALIIPLEAMLPGAGDHERLIELFLAVVIFPFLGATGLLLFGLLLHRLGSSKRAALFTSTVLAFCTPYLWYGAAPHETSQLFLIICGACYLATKENGAPLLYWVAGFLITLITWFKPLLAVDAAILTFGITLLMIIRCRGHAKSKVFSLWAGFLSGGFISVALFLIDNSYRFGHPLRSCYEVWFEQHGIEPFSMPLLKGLAGPIVSLDFGVLWLCPIIFLIRHRGANIETGAKYLWLCGWGAFLFSVLIHAKYISYAGSHAVGPRFQMHLLPFLLIPLAFVPLNRFLVLLIIYGFIAAISAKALSPSLELSTNPERFESANFAEKAPLTLPGIYGERAANLAAKLAGNLDEKIQKRVGPDLTPYHRSLMRWDFWWARAFQHSAKLGWLFTLIAFAQLTTTLAGAFVLYRRT